MISERNGEQPFVPADEIVRAATPLVEKMAGGMLKVGRLIDNVVDRLTEEKFEHKDITVDKVKGDVYASPTTAPGD